MSDSVITTLAVVFAVDVGFIVVMRVRRNLRRARDEKPVNYDFTVGELNELLRTGKLSPQEYEKAKAVVLERATAAAAAAAARLPPGQQGHGFEVIQ
jgi:hypothetical protein